MEKSKKIWLNKKLVNWQNAKIHVLTHSLHYGGGVFEGIRAYKTKNGPAVFRLPEHIKRLFYSAGAMGIKIPFSEKEISRAVLDIVKINKLNECYIRPVVFLGEQMGLQPAGAPVQTAIAAWPWGVYLGGKETISVKTSKYIRIHPLSTIPDAKISGNYANSILASLEAKEAGFDEALFLDFKGRVAEGPGENIFLVKHEKIFTPCRGSILPGITRDSVIDIAKDMGFAVVEKEITPKELKAADEAFFTGTAVEICPIGKIDRKIINRGRIGKVTLKIKKSYQVAVRGEEERYLKWLTFIS